ncbi:hypothetical protein BDR03DRAFT_739248 [Suillus americanus]|nr:hypothetical protein BDR03DRAFT_739248 [Suillus americanus]
MTLTTFVQTILSVHWLLWNIYMHSNTPHPDTTVGPSLLYSYFVAASSTVVIYDWALTFKQEFELILSKCRTFMTVIYVCLRCIGILFAVISILWNSPTVSITDVVRVILWYIQAWIPIVANAMLGVIMIARIYAMHQKSKKLLIFLIVTLLACTITSGVLMVIGTRGVSTQETTLSAGYNICIIKFDTSTINLDYESLLSTAAWEILALSLAVWIVIPQLRQSLTGSTIRSGGFEGCYRILIESHAFYFLAFAAVACFQLGALSPNITNSLSDGSAIYFGVWSIADALQMFVLGPRLILSVRQYPHTKEARAGGETGLTYMAFCDNEYELTGGDV